MSKSINYYNENAEAFFERTVHNDVVHLYKKFLPYVPNKGHILDLGCGAGRDSKYFKLQQYRVTALDGATEIVQLASEYIGQDVLVMKFKDMNFENKFDAVWAAASLLHVPYSELKVILKKIHISLKEEGMLYASFKYGDSKRIVGDRCFYDMNETLIKPYLQKLFSPIEIWETENQGKGAANSQKWFNILCRKID